jgi:GT2 family glycosyltransferase
MEISVVIPSCNTREILRGTIQALQQQTFPREAYEIIIVDRSTDGTAEMVRATEGPVPIRYVDQPNNGRSAARNLGVRIARGRVLLFLDSDLWATPTLLAEHHEHYPSTAQRVGVHGRSLIHPEARSNLFMQVKDTSPDFTVRQNDDLSPFHVTARNLSMLRADFEAAGGFDEGFLGYGFEDMEFALRLRERGVRFAYEPRALGYHYHVETVDVAQEKQRENGESAVYFWQKHGRSRGLGLFLEITPAMLPLKWLVYQTPLVTPLVRWVLPRAEARAWLPVLNECYSHLLWRAYYEGVFRVLRGRGTVPQPKPDAQRGPDATT